MTQFNTLAFHRVTFNSLTRVLLVASTNMCSGSQSVSISIVPKGALQMWHDLYCLVTLFSASWASCPACCTCMLIRNERSWHTAGTRTRWKAFWREEDKAFLRNRIHRKHPTSQKGMIMILSKTELLGFVDPRMHETWPRAQNAHFLHLFVDNSNSGIWQE